ncbi:MAG: gluconokinase [Pseudonocardiales bacterium]|nr:gluconokinase [Pseudonocardiales bacterium]
MAKAPPSPGGSQGGSSSLQLVIMGVSGSGKSTVAALTARRTGCALAEGDDFHPPASIARMAAGHPLDDTVRAPWLAAIAAWLTQRAARGECAVVSCSALRRAYREVLLGAGQDVRMVHLAGPYEVVAQRLAARRGHFMPPDLLASQYATLEPLAPDEPGITLDLTLPPTQLTDAILSAFWPMSPGGKGLGEK